MVSMERLKSGLRQSLFGVLTLVALAPAFPATAHAAEQKIGYFDVKRIIQEVAEAAEKRKVLEAEVKQKQKQLDGLKDELEKEGKEFEAKKSVLSPSAREQMQQDLQQKAMKAQQTFAELQQELGRKEQEALGDLLQKLEPVVQEIAQADGFTFVFEKNEAGLFYAPAAYDLTAQLIRKYDALHPAKSKKGEK